MNTGSVIIERDNVKINYWYAADPVWATTNQVQDIDRWCREQWGPSEWVRPEPGWNRITLDTFMFNSQEKLIAFVMRWG